MLLKQILQPFRHKKIHLQQIKEDRVETAEKPLQTIKRVWAYLIQHKLKLFLVILMVLVSSGLALLGPFVVGRTIDNFIIAKSVDGLGMILITLVFIYIGHSIAIFLQNFMMIGIAQQTVFQLRKNTFDKFHELPVSYFDQHQHGELMSRVTNDIENINTTLNQSVIEVFASILTLTGTLIIMIYLSPLLTIVTMTVIPLMFFAMRWITKRTGPLYKLQQSHLGAVNGFVEETLSGQQIVKAFSQEQYVIEEFDKRNKNLQQSSFWSNLFAGYIPKVMNMLNILSFGLIALVGGVLAIKGYVTVGVIVIFTEYARQFTRPLNELSNQFNILLAAIAGAERVFNVLDEPNEEEKDNNLVTLKEVKGDIHFDNVSFAYDKTPTLKNISFSIKSGKTIAFVGHTGSGKSTVFNLITRFYNYDSGVISLDNVPLHMISRASLRSQMAFVLQNAFLFHGTIRENIRYGNLHATDADVINAAKQANAHTFITQLSEGYNTQLTPAGGGISDGQKQLITIARAFIANPKILLLDEATSNVDTITELSIQKGLDNLMEGRTSFVIAHRLNTIKDADTIVLLENGEVAEIGNHDNLTAQKGKYYKLFTGNN